MNVSESTSLIQVIALIDEKINAQLNALLHHHNFQRLEASWRGLSFLLEQQENIIIRLLHLSLNELERDLSGSLDFDNTQLFRHIYSAELDQAGGEPFGLLLLDYQVNPLDSVDWIMILQQLAYIASYAFVPIIAGVTANFFGLNDYTELHCDMDLDRLFIQENYLRWQRLRQLEEARFLYLALPQVLYRPPYQGGRRFLSNAFFYEIISQHSDYLWGSPIYYLATMVSQVFTHHGWFTELNQARLNLPHLKASLYAEVTHHLPRLELAIDEVGNHQLSDQGFLPIISSALWAQYEIRQPHAIVKRKQYKDINLTLNHQVSTQLSYLLGACRFAHYIKLIAREKIGSHYRATDCEHYLQQWIFNYCGYNHPDSDQKKPLAKANIKVSEILGKPGQYLLHIDLQPNYQINKITTHLQFVSELNRA